MRASVDISLMISPPNIWLEAVAGEPVRRMTKV
jgi:hypothetical protein